MDHCRRVVARVAALEGRWIDDGCAQLVVGPVVGGTDALVDHLIQGQCDVIGPTQLHADFAEHRDDTGVLADRPVALGTHARIDQNLFDGVFGCGALLALIGSGHGRNEVGRVVVRDVLEGVGDALDHIGLTDRADGSRGVRVHAGEYSADPRSRSEAQVPQKVRVTRCAGKGGSAKASCPGCSS